MALIIVRCVNLRHLSLFGVSTLSKTPRTTLDKCLPFASLFECKYYYYYYYFVRSHSLVNSLTLSLSQYYYYYYYYYYYSPQRYFVRSHSLVNSLTPSLSHSPPHSSTSRVHTQTHTHTNRARKWDRFWTYCLRTTLKFTMFAGRG